MSHVTLTREELIRRTEKNHKALVRRWGEVARAKKAGDEYRQSAVYNSRTALLIAANAFAGSDFGDSERKYKKRAFLEGATAGNTIRYI
tara:strand:- start:546 stop:812 length:267 start_codon:yes stop_codon:yes gene_type:complete